jgi:PPK2 family polyphosphate:nucleotide phosphotransferase
MAIPSIRDALRVPPSPDGTIDLDGYPSDATPLAPGKKGKTLERAAAEGTEIGELQDRLYAQGTTGDPRRILLVLQGMDTAGKGGTVAHVVSAVGPEGCRIAAFKRPTPEELSHHFLWRIRKQLPGPGIVGVFDRSHYEDVLVVKVHGTIDDAECARRYDEINAFERELVDSGTTLIKCWLNISYDEQRERLLARLDEPDKHWKFNEADIDERQKWGQYQEAYAAAIAHTSTEQAPWYAVPGDRKWYRNWAVAGLLLETLRGMDLTYPDPGLDVPRLKERLRPPN